MSWLAREVALPVCPALGARAQAAEVEAPCARPGRCVIWVDLTNCPHPLVLRPVDRARSRRADARSLMTARDFAQTVQLRERSGQRARGPSARERGGRAAAKARGLAGRLAARSARWARRTSPSTSRSATAQTTSPSPRGSADPVARRCSTTSGRGAAHRHLPPRQAVVVPEAIPPERL